MYLNAPCDVPPAPLVTHGGRDARAPRPPHASGALLLYPGADADDVTGATATSVVEVSPVRGVPLETAPREATEPRRHTLARQALSLALAQTLHPRAQALTPARHRGATPQC